VTLANWQRAADLIRRFAAQELTNDEFEEAFEENAGDDKALFEIGLVIWRFYDDNYEHRLDGRHALTPEGVTLFWRCALFLQTQARYDWPLSATLPEMVDRVWRRLQRKAPPEVHSTPDAGVPEVWPFFRSEDYESAREGAR
jgi:hypothetical protein